MRASRAATGSIASARVDGVERGADATAPLRRRREPRDDAVDRVGDGVELDEIVVVEAEADGALAQLVLERLGPLDEREVVGVQVVAQPRRRHDRVLFDLEDLGEPFAHDARDLVAVDRAAPAVGLSRHRPSPHAGVRRHRRATHDTATRDRVHDRPRPTTTRARSRTRRRRRAASRRRSRRAADRRPPRAAAA